MTASIDYERLAARSLDEPLDADELATLRVWGDALETAGDSRGMLIALEHAILAHPERRHALAASVNPHVQERVRGRGALTPLLEHRRAIELEWCAGVLVGVRIDIRRLPKVDELAPEEVIDKLFSMTAIHTVRRLHVRVRRLNDRYKVLRGLCERERGGHPPLEELALLVGAAPRTIGPPVGVDYTVGALYNWANERSLVAVYPHLRLAVLDESIVPMPVPAGELTTRLADPVVRMQLGRALTSDSPELRARAIVVVREAGPAAFAFVDTLIHLLAPGMPVPQAEVAHALAAIGPRARLALPQLGVITGRPAHYDRATRRAAGAAITALRG